MGIEEKVLSEDPELNCFECDGKHTNCKTYWQYTDSICLYKIMANEDLKTYISGMSNIALEQMFVEYKQKMRDIHGKT